MKIEKFEKICNEFGGSYEYRISEDAKCLFVHYNTNKSCIFPDDMELLKKRMGKEFNIFYTYIRENRLWLCCVDYN